MERIKLPWAEKEVTAIFTKMEKEYHFAMDEWKMETGGGPGSDEKNGAWQECDESNVVTSMNPRRIASQAMYIL